MMRKVGITLMITEIGLDNNSEPHPLNIKWVLLYASENGNETKEKENNDTGNAYKYSLRMKHGGVSTATLVTKCY
jgi:hypothetical protein